MKPTANMFGVQETKTTTGQESSIASNNNVNTNNQQNLKQSSSSSSKPFLTVSPTYYNQKTTVLSGEQQKTQEQRVGINTTVESNSGRLLTSKSSSNDDVFKMMIKDEMKSFNHELKELIKKVQKTNITVGTKPELATLIQQLDDLQDISVQAVESTDVLTAEIQTLRLSINEAFSMLAEAKSKYAMFNNPE